MKNIPLTHFFHIEQVPEELQRVFLREMAANGVKHIVLTDAMFSNIFANATKREFYKALVKEFDITYLDAHAPFGKYIDLNSPVAELRKQKIYRGILAMELAYEFGVKTITFHCGAPLYPSGTLEELHNEILFTLEKLLPYAEEMDLVLCIENSWHPTATADKLLDIKKHFPDDTLGFCFDSGHAHLAENKEALADRSSALVQAWQSAGLEAETSENTLEKMLPHIVNCHLHDNDGITDSHSIPGNGTIHWENLMPLLAEAPRLQCIQNEVSEPFQKRAVKESSFSNMLKSFDHILQFI